MSDKRKGQEGQLLIEGLLLLCVMVFITISLSRLLKDNDLIPGLITKPWARVAGMAETGTWSEPDDGNRKKHPNNYGRFFTPKD